MYSFGSREIEEARRSLAEGEAPSAILRGFSLRYPRASIPDLAELARNAWGLEYEDTQCLGGWWHDGSSELSDEQIDRLLLRAIRRATGGAA